MENGNQLGSSLLAGGGDGGAISVKVDLFNLRNNLLSAYENNNRKNVKRSKCTSHVVCNELLPDSFPHQLKQRRFHAVVKILDTAMINSYEMYGTVIPCSLRSSVNLATFQ